MNMRTIREKFLKCITCYRWWIVLLLVLLIGIFVWVFRVPQAPVVEEVSVDLASEIATTTVATSTTDQNVPSEVTTESAASVAGTPVVVSEQTVSPVIPKVEPVLTPVVVTESIAVTATHRSILLTTHNQARSAVDIAPLTWSTTVAASAQSWADKLGAQGCGMTHSAGPYGENLAYSWTSRDTAPLDPADAVRRWVTEESDYTYSSNTCAPGAVCGHYTQVVWEQTTQLGCGVSVCTDEGNFTQLWVCQYNPSGNYVGEQPY
jgi:pathogenesis-related protein 1